MFVMTEDAAQTSPWRTEAQLGVNSAAASGATVGQQRITVTVLSVSTTGTKKL